jgi:hypothetical protein
MFEGAKFNVREIFLNLKDVFLMGVFLSTTEGQQGTLYGWAFVTGMKIIKHLESIYGVKAGKKMESSLLTLRSELIPERFKRALIDLLIEYMPNVGIPEEIKVEKRWSIDEYYRYSTAILAGFLDALNAWKEEQDEKKKKAREQEVGSHA